nr:helix-turn-helix transcriptional regulator [uncultured Alloprevotella sp.]
MKEKTLKFLEKNLSSEPSTFAEEAKWRQENEVWLKWSQGTAMKIIDYMQEHKLSRADIASRLGCSPQYVSKILSGHTNFSFKSIAEIEKSLNIRIMETSFA